MRYPLCGSISKRYCAIWGGGGILDWAAKKGYQNGWFSNGKVFECIKLGMLMPVYFGTYVGVSLLSTQRKGASKRMVLKRASSLNFENWAFWHPFVANQPTPYRGLSGPSGPKCRKSLENVFRGLRLQSPEKVSKKSQEQSEKTLSTLSGDSPETSHTVPKTF